MHLIKRNRSHNDCTQNIPLHNVVPEVAYNYKDYREPLIGQDDWSSTTCCIEVTHTLKRSIDIAIAN